MVRTIGYYIAFITCYYWRYSFTHSRTAEFYRNFYWLFLLELLCFSYVIWCIQIFTHSRTAEQLILVRHWCTQTFLQELLGLFLFLLRRTIVQLYFMVYTQTLLIRELSSCQVVYKLLLFPSSIKLTTFLTFLSGFVHVNCRHG